MGRDFHFSIDRGGTFTDVFAQVGDAHMQRAKARVLRRAAPHARRKPSAGRRCQTARAAARTGRRCCLPCAPRQQQLRRRSAASTSAAGVCPGCMRRRRAPRRRQDAPAPSLIGGPPPPERLQPTAPPPRPAPTYQGAEASVRGPLQLSRRAEGGHTARAGGGDGHAAPPVRARASPGWFGQREAQLLRPCISARGHGAVTHEAARYHPAKTRAETTRGGGANRDAESEGGRRQNRTTTSPPQGQGPGHQPRRVHPDGHHRRHQRAAGAARGALRAGGHQGLPGPPAHRKPGRPRVADGRKTGATALGLACLLSCGSRPASVQPKTHGVSAPAQQQTGH
jgi:hypothetical protein